MTDAEKYAKYEAAVDEDATRRGTIPHCDSRLLHAKGECQWCDERPNLQAIRAELGINFSGHYDKDKLICPAEMARNLPKIERWAGNVPWKYGEEMPSYFPDL